MSAKYSKTPRPRRPGGLFWKLAEALGVEVTPEIALPLFAAIATDTGWFRFSSVTEKTFHALAEAGRRGCSPPAVFSSLYEQHSLARLHLRGRILEHVVADCGGRLMSTHVTRADFDRDGREHD